jgi:hypothetical protein
MQSLSVKHLGMYDNLTPCITFPIELTEPFTYKIDLVVVDLIHMLGEIEVPPEHDHPS